MARKSPMKLEAIASATGAQGFETPGPIDLLAGLLDVPFRHGYRNIKPSSYPRVDSGVGTQCEPQDAEARQQESRSEDPHDA